MLFRVKKALPAVFFLFILLFGAGCGYEPDTSAPQRTDIDRSPDWRGALLYIADRDGPTEGFGSVRVYDNVSGFVEMTVEQTRAAAPSDLYITSEGSSMYVASSANGLIDKFRWDGNSWIRGTFDIETPSSSLDALAAGPDGRLYAVDATPGGGAGRLFVLDPQTDQVGDDPLVIPALASVSGISWSSDGAAAYVAGKAAGTGTSVLLILSWPSGQVAGSIDLLTDDTRHVATSPDGRFVFIMGRGEILKTDPSSGTVIGSLKPDPGAAIQYTGGDFSADGRFLFVTGTDPGGGNLYVIDLETEAVVNTVNQISRQAGGIQRVK
ncbi:MAG: hypothetical protein IBX61_06210 [Thermoleophilia bacterium]|nr:hypothetical protein [Thermoleophilia bacterium]